MGQFPIISLHEESLPALGLLFKRIFDVVISSTALVLASPMMAVIAAAIRLEAPGPIIYQATRIGRKGRPFRCCKFRTMKQDADRWKTILRAQNERERPCFKITGDPRVTRVGRFLRRYSLDELPQLWNVLKRDMSMVGPRMIPPEEMSEYKQFDMNLLTVLPGITGLWQVSGRSDISYDERVRLDMYYIRNWSIWLDLQVLYQTIPAVLGSRGAY